MNDLLCRNKRLDFKRISDALSCALQVRQFFRVDHLCQEVTDAVASPGPAYTVLPVASAVS